MEPSQILGCYRAQACSRQWRGFLTALAGEFSDALPHGDLVRLMARLGARFAQAHPLGPVDTLEGFAAAANAVWSSIDWGLAAYEDGGDRLLIHHVASPLSAVLGAPEGWDTGFLEGAYRQWLRTAGMVPVLDVAHVPGEHPDLCTYMVSRVL